MNNLLERSSRHKRISNWLTECYAQLVVVNALILISSTLVAEIEHNLGIVIAPALLVSANCTVIMVRSHAPLATPISIYILIWLVLIPLTSFEAPLMRAMTSFEWQMCGIFGLIYCISGLIVSRKMKIAAEEAVTTYVISPPVETMFLALIGASIASMIVNFAIGGVALFAEDDLARKTVSAFAGYPFFSSIGSVGIALLANHSSCII